MIVSLSNAHGRILALIRDEHRDDTGANFFLVWYKRYLLLMSANFFTTALHMSREKIFLRKNRQDLGTTIKPQMILEALSPSHLQSTDFDHIYDCERRVEAHTPYEERICRRCGELRRNKP